MYTLFDLFSCGKCIGCDKILKSYYHCGCFGKNNIVYFFPNLDLDVKVKIILTINIFDDEKNLVYLTYKNNKFYYDFTAYENSEYIFELPEKEFISNAEFLLYFNDVATKTYNNLIFI